MRRLGVEPGGVLEQLIKEPLEAREAFRPLPPPTEPANEGFRRALSDVVPNLSSTLRVVHVIGDTGGIADPNPQKAVAAAMVKDAAAGVELAYHLGDWAYYEGEAQAWLAQVFEAYSEYKVALMGIPGNHDSYDFPNWVRYMCAAKPELLPEVAEYNRDTMDQPNAYWTLTDELMTIIGMATNVPSGGVVATDQRDWLVAELKAAPTDRALIVALHHPPLSVDSHHGGSATMSALLDEAITAAGRPPHLVLSGHVHNMQRFTRFAWGHNVTYGVYGAGGYHNRHPVAADAVKGMEVARGVTLEAFDTSQWGFLRLAISSTMIAGEYLGVDKDGRVTPGVDTFTIPV